MITWSLHMFWPAIWFCCVKGIISWEQLHRTHMPVSFRINQCSTQTRWSPSFFSLFKQSGSNSYWFVTFCVAVYFILAAHALTKILGCKVCGSYDTYSSLTAALLLSWSSIYRTESKKPLTEYTIFSRHRTAMASLSGCKFVASHVLVLFPPLSLSLRCASCHKRPAFFTVSWDNKKSFNV